MTATGDGSFFGSVHYISPEQARGEKAGEPDAPLAGYVSELGKGFREAFEVIRCTDLMEKNGGDKSVCRQYMAWCADHAAGLIEKYEEK